MVKVNIWTLGFGGILVRPVNNLSLHIIAQVREFET